MRFDTKIGIVVRDDLASWQRLNVTAYLAGAIAADVPELIGEPYVDGSGNRYLPTLGQPVLVFGAGKDGLAQARERALTRFLRTAIYTEDMFATDNDADNRAVVRAVQAADLRLVGLAAYGRRNDVDKALKGLALHP
ncbi:DUF2000 domain-containing protein [Rugosimonospora africana]|uniref:DUF2000 domain-containing protein n=1 Tax=Rugosimonospora africana TaxID=556532 RepID=A0A8J3VM53_9ACTN|nr:DUF2000 domain-containing protein [Rugosimonospora africana]GIH11964.1 hypothetical protein Raf01_01360 [Rugosimonospora africana]